MTLKSGDFKTSEKDVFFYFFVFFYFKTFEKDIFQIGADRKVQFNVRTNTFYYVNLKKKFIFLWINT